jgi:hypothetical protein
VHKLKLNLSHYTPGRGLGESWYSSYSFSISALDGCEWSASRPEERTPGIHCTGGWMGPRAGLNTEDRGKIILPLPGIEPRSPGRPARSQTLYWLSYTGSRFMCIAHALLKLDVPLPHSLHSRCFLNSSFVSKARTTCGNISMAPSFP